MLRFSRKQAVIFRLFSAFFSKILDLQYSPSKPEKQSKKSLVNAFAGIDQW